MDTQRRAQIQRSLRNLAHSYKATMDLMEQILSLLCEELALDPLSYFKTRPRLDSSTGQGSFLIDDMVLSIKFRGKICFLGNTLPFKFLSALAQRPNTYVPYEDLLAEVWHGAVRSDDAVRSVVKTLRSKLRNAGLAELADAIDGTVHGHYSLKLAR